MTLKSFPIVGGAYKDDTRPYDQQDCVNYLPEMAQNPNARNAGVLRGVPGLTRVADAGDGPARGLHAITNVLLFYVRGNTLYQVSYPNHELVSRGTIAGTGLVSMAHNTFEGGYQLTIVNGRQGYVYNTNTQVLTQITAPAFPGSTKCDYIDSYIVHVAPGYTRWFSSALADATQFSSTDFYEAEASPDYLVSLVVTHLEVWLFGTETIEIWFDQPTDTATFQRAQGLLIQKGCAGRFNPAAIDNTMMWVSAEGIVYRANGYTPVRVSTNAIEQVIRSTDYTSAYSMVWIDRGHTIYYLCLANGMTFGYDCSTQLWHRRQSYGLNGWRVDCLEQWGGFWYAGDAIDGRLYIMHWNVYDEDGMPLIAERTSPYLAEAQNRMFMSAFETVMDTGQGQLDGDACVNLAYSDNGGRDYSNWKRQSLGDTGQYGVRTQWTRLGTFRSRLIRLQVSSPVRRDLIAASVQVQEAA